MTNTSFDSILDKFFDRIEKDNEFFNYFNVEDTEAIELAKKRATKYLIETLNELPSLVSPYPECDYTDYNEELQEINFELYKMDINLIVELMFTKYMEKDISLMHLFEANFIPSEVQVFSPANEKKAYMSMINDLHIKNQKTIDSYNSRDRKTGLFKKITYNYDESWE